MTSDDYDTVGYLIGEAARLLRKRFDPYAQARGLTRTQWEVLVVLMRNEGAKQGVVADLLEVEPITLSRMINRLEAAGYVFRRPDPKDRRANTLHLTRDAHDTLRDLRAVGADLLDKACRGMAAEDIDRMMEMLRLVRDNMAALDPRDAPPKEATGGATPGRRVTSSRPGCEAPPPGARPRRP
jgi:DNA-binding MarR family transcriptional regulator